MALHLQTVIGFAADSCALAGSVFLALETVFKRSRHTYVENLRNGIRLMLGSGRISVEGIEVDKPEYADELDRRRSERAARLGVAILILGFFLQVFSRSLDIKDELTTAPSAEVRR